MSGMSEVRKTSLTHENGKSNPWPAGKLFTSSTNAWNSLKKSPHSLDTSYALFPKNDDALEIHNRRISKTDKGIVGTKQNRWKLFKDHGFFTSLSPGIPKNRQEPLSLGVRIKRTGTTQNNCDELSKKSNCIKCGFRGICTKGSACVSSWLAFALKTQRELQVDTPLNQVQMLGAHNAFNTRASGYGDLDDCAWPPPYQGICLSLANQELSFTDLLNIGIRVLEIDLWFCYGKIRMSHSHGNRLLGCVPWDKELKDGLGEIGNWVNKPENTGEIIQIYFDDGHSRTKGYHELVNGPIKRHFGDKVFTPEDLRVHFHGEWPSPREIRALNKTVWFVTIAYDTHKGTYIHRVHWNGLGEIKFSQLHNCTEEKLSGSYRVYSDSTRYGPFFDGPSKLGVILDFKKYLTCGVIYPAADQINSEMVQTAVFTWAEREPQKPLTQESCVLLSGKEERWHIADCSRKHSFACVSMKDADHWISSVIQGVYKSNTSCPDGFIFSVPHNGFQHKKLVQATQGKDVWLNFTPYISLVAEKSTVKPKHICK